MPPSKLKAKAEAASPVSPARPELPFKKRLSRSPSPGGAGGERWEGWRLSPAFWADAQAVGPPPQAARPDGATQPQGTPPQRSQYSSKGRSRAEEGRVAAARAEADGARAEAHASARAAPEAEAEGAPPAAATPLCTPSPARRSAEGSPAPFGWLSGLSDDSPRSGAGGGAEGAVEQAGEAGEGEGEGEDGGEDIICGQPLPHPDTALGEDTRAATAGAFAPPAKQQQQQQQQQQQRRQRRAAAGSAAAGGGARPVCGFCGLEAGGELGELIEVAAACRGAKGGKGKGRKGAKGKAGSAGAAAAAVVHAHVECALWAPNCYQGPDGDILGVAAELQRAARLKCSVCKQGGAALGCSVPRCRKSYHLPCARIAGVVFDTQTFTALCPEHAPTAARGGKKRGAGEAGLAASPTVTTAGAAAKSKRVGAANPAAKAVVLHGASPEEAHELGALAAKAGLELLETFSAKATHVVACGASARKGAKGAMAKGAMAMASEAGKAVVGAEWLRACVDVGFLVDEAPYAV